MCWESECECLLECGLVKFTASAHTGVCWKADRKRNKQNAEDKTLDFLPFSLFFSINVVFTWDEEMRFKCTTPCRAICNFCCNVNRESGNNSVRNASVSLPQIPIQPLVPLPELGNGCTLHSAHLFSILFFSRWIFYFSPHLIPLELGFISSLTFCESFLLQWKPRG